MSTINGYLTVAETAGIIGVSESQISRYVTDGKLPHIRIGRSILVKERDAKRFKRPPVGNPNFRKKTG